MSKINISESVISRALRAAINEMIEEDRVENQDGSVEIDNFQNVREIMNFTKPGDTLYFVELIRRKKDNPSMNHSRQFIGQYYFKNQQEFDNAEAEIKNKCISQGARAYIYLNARSKAVEIDKPTLLYANLKPNGYGAQAARLAKAINRRDNSQNQSRYNNNNSNNRRNNGQRRHP